MFRETKVISKKLETLIVEISKKPARYIYCLVLPSWRDIFGSFWVSSFLLSKIGTVFVLVIGDVGVGTTFVVYECTEYG